MTLAPYAIFRRGHGPVVAAAIHNGHDTRLTIERRLALDDTEREREEDPSTGEWTQVADTQIVALRSRFEVDLNRPRDKAVYRSSEDAWGLDVWREPPDEATIAKSLQEYDEFYRAIEELLQDLVTEHGKVVLYDLHTYNHRRDGEAAPPADERTNPEVNVGTGTMDREYWAPVVDRFMAELRAYDFQGRTLDVRENVKFQGGYFGEWIHKTFPNQVCAIAIEFKKFFMNEWTGETDLNEVEAIFEALGHTVPAVEEELKNL